MNKAYIEACARRMHPDLNWPEPSKEVKEYIKRYDLTDAMREFADLFDFDGIPTPWTADLYVTATVKDKNYELDRDATIKRLALIIKRARQLKYKVEKDYTNDSFSVRVITPHGKITFQASREAVCEKKVIGRKYVPPVTYEGRYEDVVEWDCEPIALTQVEV